MEIEFPVLLRGKNPQQPAQRRPFRPVRISVCKVNAPVKRPGFLAVHRTHPVKHGIKSRASPAVYRLRQLAVKRISRCHIAIALDDVHLHAALPKVSQLGIEVLQVTLRTPRGIDGDKDFLLSANARTGMRAEALTLTAYGLPETRARNSVPWPAEPYCLQ